MRQPIVDILHVDAAKVGFYDTEDLNYFSQILEELMGDLIAEHSPLAAQENATRTKARLAIALLDCAETGERDHERLKRRALAAMLADLRRPPRARH